MHLCVSESKCVCIHVYLNLRRYAFVCMDAYMYVRSYTCCLDTGVRIVIKCVSGLSACEVRASGTQEHLMMISAPSLLE